jgi:hypothetical protein
LHHGPLFFSLMPLLRKSYRLGVFVQELLRLQFFRL